MTLAAVDAEAVLHATAATIRSRVVAETRALPLHAGSESVLDRPGQPCELAFSKRPRRAKRMQLRAPQRFVDVDVPEPGDRSLIEERSLDRRAAAFESLSEPARCERPLERLDAQSFFEVRLELTGLEQLPRAEPADVSICDIRFVV
jgi:hypothetical protein